MKRFIATISIVSLFVLVTLVVAAQAPPPAAPLPFTPVTQKMLENPSPDDWLMFSRTYDAQRYSPLKEITKQNVSKLKSVFDIDWGNGTVETIPIVHDGVMYVAPPGNRILALDAATGTTIWEYKRPGNGQTRTKAIAIYQDVILFTSADSYVVGIDARTG